MVECPLDEKRCYKKDPDTWESIRLRKIECRHGGYWFGSMCPAQVKHGLFFRVQSSEGRPSSSLKETEP